MSSRTRKILDLAKCANKSLEDDDYSPPEKNINSTLETINVESIDFKSDSFIVNDDGALIPLQTYSEVTVDDSSLMCTNVVAECVMKLPGENEYFPLNSTPGTTNVENSDFQSDIFILNEDGTLMPLQTTGVNSSLPSDSFGNITLDVSEAEALTAVKELTLDETLSTIVDNSYHSSQLNPEFNDINTIVVVAEVHSEPPQNPKPKVSLAKKNVKPFSRRLQEQVENLIEIDQPHTRIDDEEVVEPDRSSIVEDQAPKTKRRKRHQVSEDVKFLPEV
uniref:Uncharacterized protein n=1 Tax=Graphocephala atropunctata TaxID=36148 RepID=A0A1B6M016_9HEMI